MNSLIDIFGGKTTSKEFKMRNVTFVLRTLTTDELADVLRRLDMVALSDVTKMVMTRKLTLAYALESVNGVDALALPEVKELQSKNEKATKADLLIEIFGKFDDLAIRNLYSFYEQLQDEHDKDIAELKKD